MFKSPHQDSEVIEVSAVDNLTMHIAVMFHVKSWVSQIIRHKNHAVSDARSNFCLEFVSAVVSILQQLFLLLLGGH